MGPGTFGDWLSENSSRDEGPLFFEDEKPGDELQPGFGEDEMLNEGHGNLWERNAA